MQSVPSYTLSTKKVHEAHKTYESTNDTLFIGNINVNTVQNKSRYIEGV